MNTKSKAMTESHLAALVYHGWTLRSTCSDDSADTVAEYYLEWELPETSRNPSKEEIERFQFLSEVEDVFEIEGRGSVVTPGLPKNEEKKAKPEDYVVLVDQRKAIPAEIIGIGGFTRRDVDHFPLLLRADDQRIEKGMKIWIRA